jgi:hypothetical protein
MADRYATKAGVWSDPTVWDGGTLPGPGDTVRPNSYTVTIDQDVTVGALRTNAQAPAAAGGGFVIDSIPTTRTLACDIAAGTTTVVTVTATSGTLTHTGTITGGQESNPPGAVVISGTGVTAHLGDIFGGHHASGVAAGVSVTAVATVTAGAIVAAQGYGLIVSAAATITAQSATGGTIASAAGIDATAGATITVLGDCTAVTAPAVIATNTAAIIDARGTVTATNTAHGITATGLTNRVRTLVDASNGRKAMYAPGWIMTSGTQVTETIMDDHIPANHVIITNYVAGSPPPGDVRAGVIYGPGDTLMGTLVASGPLTAEQVWAHELAAGVPAADRLLATASIDSTGAQIAAAVTA